MRYEESVGQSDGELPVYSQSDGLHFMLNFTVALALLIGLGLLYLGMRGRVLWLKVWSAGLVVFSVAYLVAASTGHIR
ncbi:hypothetical protein [Thiosocius teredinicola]|uniref:hypothetical protein n=1 Tax=Thiosocius teredinicola TaxID=1973002 RepID=UPI000990A537